MKSKNYTWGAYHYDQIVQTLRRLVIEQMPNNFETILHPFDFDEMICGLGRWYTVNSGLPRKSSYGIVL